jgi:cyclic beta-1,2-glucan synthetase
MADPIQKLEPQALTETVLNEQDRELLREHARQTARSCAWIGKANRSRPKQIAKSSFARLAELENRLYALKSPEPSDDLKWLYDNLRLVHSELQDLRESVRTLQKLPLVRTATEESIPRAVILARGLIAACNYQLTEEGFSFYLESVQEIEYLRLNEIWGILMALKLSLLELLSQRGNQAVDAFLAQGPSAESFDVGRLVRSLRFIGERDWHDTLEKLSLVHRICLRDPAGVYPRMDFESRQAYLNRVSRVAPHSEVGEIDLANLLVQLAEEGASVSGGLHERALHIGYYLMDETGRQELHRRINYRRSIGSAIQHFFERFPDEIYIIGIEAVTLITVVVLITQLFRTQGSPGVIFGGLLLLLPAAGAAVELMNYLVTTVLTPRALPKLDFSKRVDPDCATMVAIPTLLINEKQIRELVDDLEVRYLVNRDPNICYALLTDLPDSSEPAGEKDARVDLAIQLIEELNQRYADEPYGGFYLFHRHRVYNPREGAWMGFERKRGKLLDLNQYLRDVFDPFPNKAGDLDRLPRIRYVLTLDSDTQLPRGSAQKMIGAMAHPLNRPFIDSELNIVTRGYGILQPRVGISVHSATRSRLASIYSGETGFDIYSRAVSDVYQDLYGEGIFTGKGIYDVDALRQVLEHRFPRNALLSHDLIEGAYARAGLASDIEVIDDYPSHYSAYNRRKHRWLRGDWQIVRWIFNRVPDESRKLVRNPISLVSRWKIVDNLRRSLMEPATFFLLVAGWYLLPGGPRFWTLVTLALLFLPIYFRLIFAMIRAASGRSWDAARQSFTDFLTSHVSIALNTAFLAHQAAVSVDAIVRTIIRTYITHSRLLEWETATEAELGIRKRTPVDVYLDWIPLLCLLLAFPLLLRPNAAPYALPFLITWACSKLLSNWLNASPSDRDFAPSGKQLHFLREIALRTWRYFAIFSNERNHWLIPDNVQEQPFRIAERLSPTNLGLLLNSRQAAVEFGYINLDEFVDLTEKTFTTILRLERHFGHFVNWYNTSTLNPIEPEFISTVDNGNFLASLWSLKEGCRELLRRPLIDGRTLAGVADYYYLLEDPEGEKNEWPSIFRQDNPLVWTPRLLNLRVPANAAPANAVSELTQRLVELRTFVRSYLPWLLPENESILALPGCKLPDMELTPVNAAVYYEQVDQTLQALLIQPNVSTNVYALINSLRRDLPACRARVVDLAASLRRLIRQFEKLSEEMDFSLLVNKGRNLLSIGFDVPAGKLNQSCYDLLASEARTATFVSVAKNDVVQDAWFRLGRQHTACEGETTLISWTGTMFEYLMPVIWMKSHANTLLDRAVRSAVRAQQSYGKSHSVPWGISEAAYSKTDEQGNYQYAAFGVPGLALSVARAGSLVVSPYSSCLALMIDPASALENLEGMAGKDWLSEYGFYESADYTTSAARAFRSRKFNLVRCWMVHHQGMSLAAICNLLCNSPFQRWFHADHLVQASEMMLQERPLHARPIRDLQLRKVMPFSGQAATTAKASP